MISLPDAWYMLQGHVSASTSTGLVSEVAFIQQPTPDEFINMMDNTQRILSFSSLAAAEEYILNYGYVNLQIAADPNLWQANPPVYVWNNRYDFIRILKLRVIA